MHFEKNMMNSWPRNERKLFSYTQGLNKEGVGRGALTIIWRILKSSNIIGGPENIILLGSFQILSCWSESARVFTFWSGG